MRRFAKYAALTLFVVAFLTACATKAPREEARQKPALLENVYLANNIHMQDEGRYATASYANWTDCDRHEILPVNTPVTIRNWGNGFVILSQGEDKRTVYFEYDRRRMEMSVEQYLEEITELQKIDIGSLSAVDKKGIERGEARQGMSKRGVRIALGYPARHETPSLDDHVWTYWTNRWGRYNVIFDSSGSVQRIEN